MTTNIEARDWTALEVNELMDALVDANAAHAALTKTMDDLDRAKEARTQERHKVDGIIIGIRSELRSRVGERL